MTALQIGLDLSTSAASGADPVADARAAEALGYDFVSASDHPSGSHPTFETWTLLAWVAASTERIQVASRVLGVPYRPPAMVAKMAETLDRLSNGRLILGLGGGFSDDEFRAFGLTVPTPREKIDGLEDAIDIARGLWSQPSFTYRGAHYQTQDAALEPKPGHHIPIWLGTFGPRALALTGRLADGWIPTLGHALPEQVPAMRERILRGADDAGRDPADITCVYNLQIRVGEQPERSPSTVSGSAEAVIERLLSFVDLGFTAFNFMPVGPDRDEQVERLAREVIPALRTSDA
jgi:alkanesulfonate monooxygenase SsuD/methylene tetrahydromethanopterin reductase-like flavin-dependent oxidoreductase (luciferase family)